MGTKMTPDNYGRLLIAIVFILGAAISGWIIHSTNQQHNPRDMGAHILIAIGGLLLMGKVLYMYIKGE